MSKVSIITIYRPRFLFAENVAGPYMPRVDAAAIVQRFDLVYPIQQLFQKLGLELPRSVVELKSRPLLLQNVGRNSKASHIHGKDASVGIVGGHASDAALSIRDAAFVGTGRQANSGHAYPLRLTQLWKEAYVIGIVIITKIYYTLHSNIIEYDVERPVALSDSARW